MLKLHFCIMLLMLSTALFAQASSSTTASATIVTAVGTENMEQAGSGTFSVARPLKPVFLNVASGSIQKDETWLNNQRQIQQVASIKLRNNNFAFGILPVNLPNLVGTYGVQGLLVDKIDANVQSSSKLDISCIISIAATIKVKANMPAGYYYGAQPLEVIINFE